MSSLESPGNGTGAMRRLHIEQLEYARELSILLYTRDRSTHNLAKKLKAVFNRIYISGEIKDSQKFINKLTHDVTEPKPVVDVVSDLIILIFSILFRFLLNLIYIL